MDLGGETDSLNRGWKTMAHRINLASDLYLFRHMWCVFIHVLMQERELKRLNY